MSAQGETFVTPTATAPAPTPPPPPTLSRKLWTVAVAFYRKNIEGRGHFVPGAHHGNIRPLYLRILVMRCTAQPPSHLPPFSNTLPCGSCSSHRPSPTIPPPLCSGGDKLWLERIYFRREIFILLTLQYNHHRNSSAFTTSRVTLLLVHWTLCINSQYGLSQQKRVAT